MSSAPVHGRADRALPSSGSRDAKCCDPSRAQPRRSHAQAAAPHAANARKPNERDCPLQLDHLTIIAPTLDAGAEHVRNRLGVDMPFGGRHPEMGTHNLLLRLGDDVFLEVIAVDPAAADPGRARWFGLSDRSAVEHAWDAGRRLRGWVVRTSNIDAMISAHGAIVGQKRHVSRGDRSWSFSVPPDGSLPLEGVAPSVIDWGEPGHPAMTIRDLDLRLVEFSVEHPEPTAVSAVYERLGIHNPPLVRKGGEYRYRALIRTPTGLRELC
jgi:Glyoxalase-like domain